MKLRSATRPSRPPAWKNAFRRAWARGAQVEIESGDPRLRPGSWDGFGLLGRRIWRYRQKTETLAGGKPTFGGTAKCSFQHSAGYQMWGVLTVPLLTEEKGGTLDGTVGTAESHHKQQKQKLGFWCENTPRHCKHRLSGDWQHGLSGAAAPCGQAEA